MSPLRELLSRHGYRATAPVPPAYLVFVVIRYAVAVPYRDQWELVPLLDNLGLADRDVLERRGGGRRDCAAGQGAGRRSHAGAIRSAAGKGRACETVRPLDASQMVSG